MRNADAATRAELRGLVEQLNDASQHVSHDRAEEVEALAAAVPTVLTIPTQIASTIQNVTGP